LGLLLSSLSPVSGEEKSEPIQLDQNLKCVDFTDLKKALPLDVGRSTQILWRSEEWKQSNRDPEKDHDSVGYPFVVKNDPGTPALLVRASASLGCPHGCIRNDP
jgi:hypothetical protein